MQTVTAIEKQTFRVRPVPRVPTRPKAEVLTTHSGICPRCGVESRLGLGREVGAVYGGCVHLVSVEQQGTTVLIQFGSQAA
jgi:hypothetical protein